MKNKVRNIVKYNKYIYNIYFFLMNLLLKLIDFFYLNKKNIILFSSFGGKGYNDSPKAIYEYLINHKLLRDYKLIWAFENSDNYPEIKNKVKIDTIKYFIYAISAKAWVTNSSMERGLKFKSKNTYCLNTWHGTPLKRMGVDIVDKNTSFKGKGNVTADAFCVQSDYEAQIFSNAFELPNDRIYKFGLPRNDILSSTNIDKKKLRNTLSIPVDKYIVLYAPTFREYDKSDGVPEFLQTELIEEISNKLSEDTVFLVRAHYEISKQIESMVFSSENIIDVSDYGNINDLYLISDCLVSDYSSVFFDYSITKKPMLVFQYDHDKYLEERGLYFDIQKKLTSVDNVNELIEEINEVKSNIKNGQIKSQQFNNEYINYQGEATRQCSELLVNKLND